MEKKIRSCRDLNSDLWIQSPRCSPLHHRTSTRVNASKRYKYNTQRTRVASNRIRNQIPLRISYCGRVGGLCDEEVWLTFVYPSRSVRRHVKDVYAIEKATVYWIITLNVGQESCCSLPTCTGDVKEREGEVGGTRQGVFSMCCMCAGKSMCVYVCMCARVWGMGCVWREDMCTCVWEGERQKWCCNEVESVHSTVANTMLTTDRWWLPCIYTNMHTLTIGLKKQDSTLIPRSHGAR